MHVKKSLPKIDPFLTEFSTDFCKISDQSIRFPMKNYDGKKVVKISLVEIKIVTDQSQFMIDVCDELYSLSKKFLTDFLMVWHSVKLVATDM